MTQSKPFGVELAYLGVHEIFQMAIAAEEMHVLSGLQCSFFDGPGKWGRLVSKFTRLPSASPLGSDALPAAKVHEIPGPQIAKQLALKWRRKSHLDPLPFFQAFEERAAKRLRQPNIHAKIAVAAETCALGFFQQAKSLGMKCMLDSHGIPAPFLDDALRRAAAEFQLPLPPKCDSAAMIHHKEQERSLADVIIFCSELQQQIWCQLGVPPEKSKAIPLWVDSDFWQRTTPPPTLVKGQPLKIAAVGAGTLGKGLPYLLQAAAQLGDAIKLSLVGGISGSLQPMLAKLATPPACLPYMSRTQLREFLSAQHLLVMPSLGDSFGFIAMEAMACGLPVIVTTHCGVPVPDPSWRVPAHDGPAIAERIQHYLDHPGEIPTDGARARAFASLLTPQRYRDQIKLIYRDLLLR